MSKVKVEIFENDPFAGGGCCGPGGGSMKSALKLRQMLTEREELVSKLQAEFKESIKIKREVVNARKSLENYPPHARAFIAEETSLPFILIDEQLVVKGRIPQIDEFKQLINTRLK
jgi:hypothetical protein